MPKNNLKGDKMILDIELTAKPITDGEFWILTDGKNKVGNVSANIEGYGVNLQAGYLFSKNWELTGRFSTIDMKEKEVSNQYTLGVSKYIFGQKLKVQSDISYLTIADITDELLFRLQLEVHF